MKTKTIDIKTKEWWDKANGNSYFSAHVIVNYQTKGEKIIKLPFQYGYGDQSVHEGLKALKEQGFINTTYTSELREQKIILRTAKQEGCLQRDVKAFGLN